MSISRTFSLVALLSVTCLISGCGDPVDRLLSRLSAEKDFDLGMSVYSDLPPSATPHQIASNAFFGTFINPKVTNFTVIEVRSVKISGAPYEVLHANTSLGEKLVLFKLNTVYTEGTHTQQWWSRVYEVK